MPRDVLEGRRTAPARHDAQESRAGAHFGGVGLRWGPRAVWRRGGRRAGELRWRTRRRDHARRSGAPPCGGARAPERELSRPHGDERRAAQHGFRSAAGAEDRRGLRALQAAPFQRRSGPHLGGGEEARLRGARGIRRGSRPTWTHPWPCCWGRTTAASWRRVSTRRAPAAVSAARRGQGTPRTSASSTAGATPSAAFRASPIPSVRRVWIPRPASC